jgi:hypothetical protein
MINTKKQNEMKKNLTYLIAIAAIMLLSFGVKAQGGLAPLVGSTHVYTVTPGSAGNTKAWSVSPATGYNVNSGASTEQVNITWTTAGTYTLSFTETNTTTSCATVKTATVVVGENTFDVSVTANAEICNSLTGAVNNTDANATTSITFTVNMVTGISSFEPEWEIKFTLAPGTATLASVTESAGTLTESAGTYTLTAIPSASGSGTVDITMNVTGSKIVAQSVVLTIISAKELTYNTPDVDNNDWTATQVINAVPNTSDISAN